MNSDTKSLLSSAEAASWSVGVKHPHHHVGVLDDLFLDLWNTSGWVYTWNWIALTAQAVSALEMSAFEIDITRNLVIESNTILLPDKNKLKTFQLGDTADFSLNRAGEIHCQLFPKANLSQSWCSKIEHVSSYRKIILFLFFHLTKHKSTWEVQRARQQIRFWRRKRWLAEVRKKSD